ncbi:MAG TPA: hypothetical protein VFV08_06605 [Puia sp.]|nr:hypothetical protein [Puia sp.]
MIAYNKSWLDNLNLHHQLEEAYSLGCISKEEWEASKKEYPLGFYSPNLFMRIGLFILTFIISSFGLGFCAMLIFSSGAGEHVLGIIAFVLGVIHFFVLEFWIRKGHFRSGVDDALLWMGAALLFLAFNMMTTISSLGNSVLVLVIALVCVLRYIDGGMAVLASLSLFSTIFFAFSNLGGAEKAIAAFFIMAAAAILYLIVRRIRGQDRFRYYSSCLLLVKITALVGLYAAANYYVVKEMSALMFDLPSQHTGPLPLGWLFWFLTIAIPIAYIAIGIRRKDVVPLRTGLILVAATIFTIRYYYAILPIEFAMVYGGFLLIMIAYGLTKYLKIPRRGFTSEENKELSVISKIQVESLVIAEIASGTAQQIASPTRFGGGSGGGGGAGGEF